MLTFHVRLVMAGLMPLLEQCASAASSHFEARPTSSFPLTLESFAPEAERCPDRVQNEELLDAAPQRALLQAHFHKATEKSTEEMVELDSGSRSKEGMMVEVDSKVSIREGQSPTTTVFKWGVTPQSEHPRSIGKGLPHPSIQDYEASLPYLTGSVLNIFVNNSNGAGGLLLAMEVPSPCGAADTWIEVDRSRCSSKYPCTLRLPAGAVRGSETEPTKFRTRVVAGDDDYLTDFLEYLRVKLDLDAEVKVAHEKFQTTPGELVPNRTLKFSLNPALASGALSVTPVIHGATAGTLVSMRIRQPAPQTNDEVLPLLQESTSDLSSAKGMQMLQMTLNSYRKNWAETWRESSKPIQGCNHDLFEVVADQLYPGEVELEVSTSGSDGAFVSEVLVTTRVSWAEAEVALLDNILQDHFGYFNDPEVLVAGLPMDAYKTSDPKKLTDSNPTSWGYAMESWVIMAETGKLKPEETVAKLSESFQTLEALQQDPNAFVHGLFYPYFSLRSRETGEKIWPKATDLKDMPCGDDALFYASIMMVHGWLSLNNFQAEADVCSRILGRFDFSKCQRVTDCNMETNGQNSADPNADGDKFWAVPLTFHAETLQPNSFNWNVWADEGGPVAMIVALSGGVNGTQFESIVGQQQKYSPCSQWEGITVGHTAFFNSIFTLPTRSLLGLGTLFTSPYYHEFAVRSVLPSFRAHQKLKKKIGADYMGPSDAMTQMPRTHPGRMFGSYAYWPPNNFYDCRKKFSIDHNKCTWCRGVQMEGDDLPFDMIVPHGIMASFLTAAMMEKSQFSSWLEETKLLITDSSGIYTPGYGLEVVAPSKRTPLGGKFEGAYEGRGIFEALSHGYTILSMYEGLATMRRRFELVKQAGFTVSGSYEPPKYKPLSDFTNALPEVHSKINKLLAVASRQVSTERQCAPSEYGPASGY